MALPRLRRKPKAAEPSPSSTPPNNNSSYADMGADTQAEADRVLAAYHTGQAFAQLIATQQDATLPRFIPEALFGPGIPVPPGPIDPPDPATGRPAPRQYQYPVSWNLPGITGKLIPWQVLRDAADVGLIRRCIEVRKQQLTGLDWDIGVRKTAIEAERQNEKRADAGKKSSRSEIEGAMRDRLRPDIERIRQFWRRPDRQNGYNFAEWLGNVLEELLVLDALAIYPRHTKGGQLYGFEVLDGSTIKPLLDNRGMRPSPPNAAYQQILQGFSRGEFTATTSPDAITPDNPLGVLNPWNADSLIYKRRLIRTWTPYGFSPVEQCLTEMHLWMKRQEWLTAEYDDGAAPNVPVALSEAMAERIKSPAELRAWEAGFNADLAGDARARHRAKFLPPGATIPTLPSMDSRYKKDFDEFLIKLLCTFFDLSPASLGFMESGGLGGASYHEGQADVEERKGVLPWCRWLSDFIEEISTEFLDMPPELEFRFLGLDEEDEAAASAVTDEQVRGGRLTLNEARDRHGQDRFDFPEADEPVIVASRNIVFINGEMARQAQAAAAPDAMTTTGGPIGGAPGNGATGQPNNQPKANPTPRNQPAGAGQAKAPAGSADKQKADELDAFVKFASKGDRGRAFQFEHVDPVEALVLNKLLTSSSALAVEQARAAARDARGRVSSSRPGERTEALAGVSGARRTAGTVRDFYQDSE